MIGFVYGRPDGLWLHFALLNGWPASVTVSEYQTLPQFRRS